MDLFRYDENHKRSFNTANSSEAYFSLDGTNQLVEFNQDDSGDFHDWYSVNGGQLPRIQDAFATPGATPDFMVELIALDVIGYHLLVPSIAISKTGTNKEKHFVVTGHAGIFYPRKHQLADPQLGCHLEWHEQPNHRHQYGGPQILPCLPRLSGTSAGWRVKNFRTFRAVAARAGSRRPFPRWSGKGLATARAAY